MSTIRTILATAALSLAAPAFAACPAAAPFAGWERAAPLAAVADHADARGAALRVGKAALLTLRPAADLRFSVAPGKPVAAGTSGGTVAFVAPAAGRYRIAAGGPVWLDLIERGKPVASAAHGHGPDCGPVRKIVDFDLNAGPHLLQLSGAATPAVTVMVARAR